MCTLLCIARGGHTLMKSNPGCRMPHNRKVVSFRNPKAIETATITEFFLNKSFSLWRAVLGDADPPLPVTCPVL